MFSGLGGEESLRLVSVAFSFSVFLVGILYVDFFVHEELFVHAFDRFVGGFEGVVGYETETFGDTGFVAGNLEI